MSLKERLNNALRNKLNKIEKKNTISINFDDYDDKFVVQEDEKNEVDVDMNFD